MSFPFLNVERKVAFIPLMDEAKYPLSSCHISQRGFHRNDKYLCKGANLWWIPIYSICPYQSQKNILTKNQLDISEFGSNISCITYIPTNVGRIIRSVMHCLYNCLVESIVLCRKPSDIVHVVDLVQRERKIPRPVLIENDLLFLYRFEMRECCRVLALEWLLGQFPYGLVQILVWKWQNMTLLKKLNSKSKMG